VDRRESTKQEHKEIVDALVSLDAKRVSGALRQHLRTAEKNISKAIKSKIKTGG
jgi:DNA-binding GntR family transcriptional regulator